MPERKFHSPFASPSPSETVAALPADVWRFRYAKESTSFHTTLTLVGSQYVWHRSRCSQNSRDRGTGKSGFPDSGIDLYGLLALLSMFPMGSLVIHGELCVGGQPNPYQIPCPESIFCTGDGDLEKVEELFVIFFPVTGERHPPGISQWIRMIEFSVNLQHFLPDPSLFIFYSSISPVLQLISGCTGESATTNLGHLCLFALYSLPGHSASSDRRRFWKS